LVTICEHPQSDIVRDIDTISIFNNDTVESTIEINILNDVTPFQLVKTTLSPNDTFIYTHGHGYKTIDLNGSIKTSMVNQLIPHGVTNSIQYNNSGEFAGADNVFINDGNLNLQYNSSSTNIPVTDSINLYAKKIANRLLVGTTDKNGIITTLQPNMARNKIAL